MYGFWLGYKIRFCKNKKNSAVQRGSEHDSTMSERWRQLSKGQKKHFGQFTLFLLRETNDMHEFSCTLNAVCVHVPYMVVNLRAIFEGLSLPTNTSGFQQADTT